MLGSKSERADFTFAVAADSALETAKKTGRVQLFSFDGQRMLVHSTDTIPIIRIVFGRWTGFQKPMGE